MTLPSRKITPRSYSRRIRRALARKITPSKTRKIMEYGIPSSSEFVIMRQLPPIAR
jgi:hypothetical protein